MSGVPDFSIPPEQFRTTIPKGALITFTQGEYSDYQVHGVFRATQDIEAEAVRGDYLTRPGHIRRQSESEFIALLISQGLIEEVASTNWHLDDRYLGGTLFVDVTEYEGKW